MTDSLINNCQTLLTIRKYLIKKGQSRYKGNVIEIKLTEAKNIFDKSTQIILLLKSSKNDKLSSAVEIFNDIKKLYEEINKLCVIPIQVNLEKMEFDLRVACSLIPVMDGVEDTTKRLIDSVEMYADMLDKSGEVLLIIFVLKNRLSESAKLRISTSYTSVKELITDLRQHLLPKKSFVAVQTQLQNVQQGSRSVEVYGSEVEKLFTELTISQADGNSETFKVLKPLNEKLALQRFSGGLRSSKLGTIISARNYTSLKDAIQAAKDEEATSCQSSSGNVMHVFKNGHGYQNIRRPNGQGHGSRNPNQRGRMRGQYSYYNRGSRHQYSGAYPQAFRGNFRGYYRGSPNGQRGNRGPRYFRNQRQGPSVYSVEHDPERQRVYIDNNIPQAQSQGDNKPKPDLENPNQFFRF